MLQEQFDSNLIISYFDNHSLHPEHVKQPFSFGNSMLIGDRRCR